MQAVHLYCQVQQKLPSGWQGGINLKRTPSVEPWRAAVRKKQVERSPGIVLFSSGGLATCIYYPSFLISRCILRKTTVCFPEMLLLLRDAVFAEPCNLILWAFTGIWGGLCSPIIKGSCTSLLQIAPLSFPFLLNTTTRWLEIFHPFKGFIFSYLIKHVSVMLISLRLFRPPYLPPRRSVKDLNIFKMQSKSLEASHRCS